MNLLYVSNIIRALYKTRQVVGLFWNVNIMNSGSVGIYIRLNIIYRLENKWISTSMLILIVLPACHVPKQHNAIL